jgi:hypothetical protein
MDIGFLLGVLALGTMLAVTVFALVSKRSVEDRRDSDAPKSRLAKDAPDR